MTTEQAISVLVTGAKIGQSKGAFTLEDASVIMEAIKALTPAQPEPVKDTEIKTDSVPSPENFIPENKTDKAL